MSNFQSGLKNLINTYSKENGSDTPDFILAQFLIECLTAFDKAVKTRCDWYTRKVNDSEIANDGHIA